MASPDRTGVGGCSGSVCRAAPGLSNGPRAGSVPVQNSTGGRQPTTGIASKAGKEPRADVRSTEGAAVLQRLSQPDRATRKCFAADAYSREPVSGPKPECPLIVLVYTNMNTFCAEIPRHIQPVIEK